MIRPPGRARKPEAKPGLSSSDRVRGAAPSAWLKQDPAAKPSYDSEQEARAKALLEREKREMDAAW